MQPVRDFESINADIAIWHAYDPDVKADLYSTWLVAADEAYVVDPIRMHKTTLDELISRAPIAGIVVTNSNHHRAAAYFAQQFAVPIYADAAAFPNGQPEELTAITDGQQLRDGLCAIRIEGAAPGETAFYNPASGGTLIIGDALINFGQYGFALLPRKYCSNQKEMRRSLRKLLSYKGERILFAHGPPILSRASERLQILLDTYS